MNKKIRLLINLVVIGLFIYLYTQLDYKSIMNNLKAVPPMILVGLVILQIADMLLINYQNQRLTNYLGYDLSFWRMNFITSMGHVFDAVTPGGGVGGEAVKIMMLKKHANVPVSSGTAAILAQKAISICAMLVFCTGGFLYLTFSKAINLPLIVEIGICSAIVGIAMLMLYIFRNPGKYIEKCRRIKREKVREALINFLSGIEKISSSRKEFLINIGLSFITWFIYPFKLVMILRVTNVQIDFISVYAILFLSYATAMLPIFPGGMLGFEVSMSSLLGAFGVTSDKSIFITTLFRIITYWFVIAASMLYVGIYKVVMMVAYRNPRHEELK